MRARRLLLAAVAAIIFACDEDPLIPTRTGSITLNVVTAESPPAPSLTLTDDVAPAPMDALNHLDSARATVVAGATNRTITLTKGTGFTGTISDLAAGSYTVTVLGYAGGEVDYYGSTPSVSVTAGQTSVASISWNSFLPLPAAIATPTAALRFAASWPVVPGADSYKVEIDRNVNFSTVTRTNVTTASNNLTVTDTGTYYVRVRSSNPRVALGRPSNTQTVRVVRNPAEPADNSLATPTFLGLATGTSSFSGFNIFPVGDQDYFSVYLCQGDSLNLSARAVRLTPPSILDSFLQLWKPGDTLVATNNDSAGTNSDAFIGYRTTAEGPHKIRVASAGAAIGHYDLTLSVVAGPNQAPPGCKGSSTNVAQVVITPGSVLVTAIGGQQTPTAQPKDNAGANVNGKTVTWLSLNPGIASVNPTTGVVTAVASGQTSLAATADGVTGYATVQVNATGAVPATTWGTFSTGQTVLLNGVWGYSPNETYYAVGANGSLLKYTGGAGPLSIVSSGVVPELRGVFGFSPTNVYAVGVNGTILRYDGSNATPMVSGSSQILNGIWGSSPNAIYAVGNGGLILRYNGSYWAPMTSPTTQNLHAIWGAGEDAIWAVGASGTVLRYAGSSWTVVAAGTTTQHLYGVHGASSSDVVAVGAAGTIIRFNGSSWTSASSGTTQQLNAIWGSGTSEFVAVGTGGTVLRYGPTPGWNLQTATTTQSLNAVWGYYAGNVYVVGANGTGVRGQRGSVAAAASVAVTPNSVSILATNSAPVSAQAFDAGGAPVSKTFSWRALNPALASVNPGPGTVTALSHGQTAIAASADGVTGYSLMNFTASGLIPSGAALTLNPGTTTALSDVWAAGPSDVFVASGDGRVRRFNGTSWTASPPLATCCGVNALWGVAPDEIYATLGGGVSRFDGISWHQHFAGQAQPLFDIWAASPRDIHAVGAGGVALHYDGNAWSVVASGTGHALHAVWGAAPNQVFAVGNSGTIIRWNGSAWAPQASNTSAHLWGVWGVSPSDVYAVGDNGTLVRYNGSIWSVVSTGQSANFSGIWGTSATDIYVAADNGGAGRLFRYNGTTWSTAGTSPQPLQDVTGAGSSVFAVGGNGRAIQGVRGAASVTLTPPGNIITAINGTVGIGLSVKDADGVIISRPVTWNSLNPSVATVNGGTVTAVGTGQAIISATADAAVGYTLVTVTDVYVPVSVWSTVTPAASVPFRGVWGSSPSDVFAVGDGGSIQRFNGSAWTEMTPTGTTGTLRGVWGASASDVYAYGQSPNGSTSHITRFNGSSWTLLNGVPGTDVTAMWGDAPNHVWAAIGSLGNLHTFDGMSWGPLAGSLGDQVNAIWGTSANQVIAVGNGGLIHEFDGNNWSPMATSGTWPDLHALWGTSGNDVWAVGKAGTIIRYTGATWVQVGSNTAADLHGISGVSSSARQLIAVGSGGTVLRFDGATWRPVPTPTTAELRGAWGSSGSDVTVVGTSGVLLKGVRSSSAIPPAPSGVAAAPASPWQINLSWTDNSANEDGFTIERCVGAGCTSFVEVGAVGAGVTAFQNAGLAGNTTYEFRVRAYSAGGESSPSVTQSATPPLPVEMIAASGDRTCVLRIVGQSTVVDCWGDGQYGGLGIPFTSTPTRIGSTQQFRHIISSGTYDCGLTFAGAIYCWGGPFPSAGASVNLPGGNVAIAITGGYLHACAVGGNGVGYCWGYNAQGQLGDGSTNSTSTPLAVQMPAGVTFHAISAGSFHTCALERGSSTTPNRAWCWGEHNNGKLGLGSETGPLQTVPVPVSGAVTTFSRIGAGPQHTCGTAASNGHVYCWGANYEGQIGNSTFGPPVTTPVATSLAAPFSSLTVSNGAGVTCGTLASNGQSYCWGANYFGNLGVGDRIVTSVPTAQSAPELFTSISLGGSHGCARGASGTFYCWGWNQKGQLGDGSVLPNKPLAAVSGGQAFKALGVGANHTCGITQSNLLYCWGYNATGVLGIGNTTSQAVPAPVAPPGGASSWLSITAGRDHSCGVTNLNQAWCWGANYYGQLGNSSYVQSNVPALVSGGHSFSSVAAGDAHSCGRRTDGLVFCWGFGAYGQLGNGGTATNNFPLQSGATVYADVTAGSWHTCAWTAGGVGYCWGRNTNGAIGNGTDQNNQPSPTLVNGGLAFASMSGGEFTTCGRTTANLAYCWGYGGQGSLGNNGFQSSTAPVQVSGGHAWATLAASPGATCGATASSVPYCWGVGYSGQIGNGTFYSYNNPTAVPAGQAYTGIRGGTGHTCGFTAAGATYCWGQNQYGQLGTPANVQLTPLAVSTLTAPPFLPFFGARR